MKVDFGGFCEIPLTWGVFFGPTTGRPHNVYRRNERIGVSAFQRISARPKRIRISEVTIVNPTPQNQKNGNSICGSWSHALSPASHEIVVKPW